MLRLPASPVAHTGARPLREAAAEACKMPAALHVAHGLSMDLSCNPLP